MRTKSTYQVKWDAIGIGASLACAIHCVLLPVLFTTVSFLGIEVLHNAYLETLTLLASMSVGGWAIRHGYIQHHHNKWLLVSFITGLILMLIGNFVHSFAIELVLKLVGAVLIVIAHVKNWQACRVTHED
jgi:hypothetical protein